MTDINDMHIFYMVKPRRFVKETSIDKVRVLLLGEYFYN